MQHWTKPLPEWRSRRLDLRVVVAVLLGSVVTAVYGCGGSSEPAVERGDRLWADSNYTAALAEYRLALEQESGSDPVLVRVAHAYLKTGEFERGKEAYDRLLQRDSDYTDQAVFDYMTVARQAHERSDQYGMAVAVDAAATLRPGLPLDGMAAPLARYYATSGAPERAIVYYERALSDAPADSVPSLLFELGEVHEALGGCEEALGFFKAYRERAPRGEHADQARWHTGNCSFILARRARQSGDLENALRHTETVIDLGVPRNIQDQAWFEHAETLLALGRRDEALTSFRMVLELNRTGSGQLVDRAQRRIDELRFGSPDAR